MLALNLSKKIYVVLLVLFVLLSTRTEFDLGPSSSTYSFILRALSAVFFVGILAWKKIIRFKTTHVAISLLITLIFFFSNFLDLTISALIACFAIYFGLAVAGLARYALDVLLLRIIQLYLFLNIFSLLIAIVVYKFGFSDVDLHSIVFPWSDSRGGRFVGVDRVTGIQVEPGTYANITYIVVIISCIIRRRIFGIIELFAISSAVFTFSAWSVIGMVFYILACAAEYAFRSEIRNSLLSKIILYFILSIALWGLFLWLSNPSGNLYLDYFTKRLNLVDGLGSGKYKTEAFDAWVEVLGSWMIFPNPMTSQFCDLCISPQDIGLFLNSLFYFGLLLSIPFWIVFGVSGVRVLGLPFLFLMIPFGLIKNYYYDPIVWVVFGLVLFSGVRPIKRSKKFRSTV